MLGARFAVALGVIIAASRGTLPPRRVVCPGKAHRPRKMDALPCLVWAHDPCTAVWLGRRSAMRCALAIASCRDALEPEPTSWREGAGAEGGRGKWAHATCCGVGQRAAFMQAWGGGTLRVKRGCGRLRAASACKGCAMRTSICSSCAVRGRSCASLDFRAASDKRAERQVMLAATTTTGAVHVLLAHEGAGTTTTTLNVVRELRAAREVDGAFYVSASASTGLPGDVEKELALPDGVSRYDFLKERGGGRPACRCSSSTTATKAYTGARKLASPSFEKSPSLACSTAPSTRWSLLNQRRASVPPVTLPRLQRDESEQLWRQLRVPLHLSPRREGCALPRGAHESRTRERLPRRDGRVRTEHRRMGADRTHPPVTTRGGVRGAGAGSSTRRADSFERW